MASNPYGSKLRFSGLPYHEGIDFVTPYAGLIENWKAGLNKGFRKLSRYDERKKK